MAGIADWIKSNQAFVIGFFAGMIAGAALTAFGYWLVM